MTSGGSSATVDRVCATPELEARSALLRRVLIGDEGMTGFNNYS